MTNIAKGDTSTGRGALAMLDALGFRGIWRNYHPDIVLAKMRALHQAGDAAITALLSGPNQPLVDRLNLSQTYFTPRVYFACLSDTIVVGVPMRESRPGHKPTQNASDGVAVALAATFVSEVLRLALDDAPHLAFRGCVTIGKFAVDDGERFIVGPAVDEAAALHEQVEAAIVWLSPEARRVWTTDAQRSSAFHRVVPYCVPLKGGSSFDTFGVTPFAHASSTQVRDDVTARMLTTFDRDAERVEVGIKRQNTARFLDAVRSVA